MGAKTEEERLYLWVQQSRELEKTAAKEIFYFLFFYIRPFVTMP